MELHNLIGRPQVMPLEKLDLLILHMETQCSDGLHLGSLAEAICSAYPMEIA